MKIVIDTNVLISAAFRDREPEDVILFIVEHLEFEWIVSDEILDEYLDVLNRPKFNLPEDILNQWTQTLRISTTTIDVDQTIAFPRDRKDAKFIACALSAQANFCITGDRDFSEAHKLMNTTVVSVALFKKLICDTWT